MKFKKPFIAIFSMICITIGIFLNVFSYPGQVGLTGKSKDCLSCHVNNGQWDDGKTIIDILDKETLKTFKQADGSFLIEIKRREQKTILLILGRQKEDGTPAPVRNAWLFIDPATIESSELNKFAPQWAVNIQLGCRITGDEIKGLENTIITASAMTIQPLSDAKDAEIQLQAMLTKGESVKGNAKTGMIGNYFERKVMLKVLD